MRIMNVMLAATAALPTKQEVVLTAQMINEIVHELDLIRAMEDYSSSSSSSESMSDYDYELFFGNFEPIQFEWSVSRF